MLTGRVLAFFTDREVLVEPSFVLFRFVRYSQSIHLYVFLSILVVPLVNNVISNHGFEQGDLLFTETC